MSDAEDDVMLLCHRCGRGLRSGRGDFYVVRIEAVADPSPPDISEELLKHPDDLRSEMEALIDRMKDLSAQELADQVYRRLTIHLCRRCYASWIEDPAGSME